MILEKNGERGLIGFLDILSRARIAYPQYIDTANALRFENIKKAVGCSRATKLLQFFETPKCFAIYLWTHNNFRV